MGQGIFKEIADDEVEGDCSQDKEENKALLKKRIFSISFMKEFVTFPFFQSFTLFCSREDRLGFDFIDIPDDVQSSEEDKWSKDDHNDASKGAQRGSDGIEMHGSELKRRKEGDPVTA